MIRWLLLLVGLVCLVGAAPPRDWTRVVNRTPAGTFVLGNPAAPVKLVEYVSYTCPHCAHLTAESAPVLRAQWVRSGSTSVEVRHQIHEALDLAAALLARCAGPRFFEVTDAFYAAQTSWYPRGADFIEANQARMAIWPTTDRLRAYADAAGLTDLARAHGLAPAAAQTCFANDTDMNRVLAMTQAESATVSGTPTFAINGKLLGVSNWQTLMPQLRAAGAH
jgi:protein-disulfide isomerase